MLPPHWSNRWPLHCSTSVSATAVRRRSPTAGEWVSFVAQPSDIDEAHAGGRLEVEVCGHRYGISDNFENAQDQMAELPCDQMSRTGRL